MEYKKYPNKIFMHWLTSPLIWLPLIPMLITDVLVEIFHRVCFAVYGINYINRSEYIIFDRQKLNYLPWYDKIFCTYCAYANGVFMYWVAIASATEKYWCAIKHQKATVRVMKDAEVGYLEYGDKEAFDKLNKIK